MQYILYSVICVYSIPIIGILFSIYFSAFFTIANSPWVNVAGIIAQTHFVTLRDIFSAMIVPLVTAFSVPSLTADKIIPKQTKVLFTIFIILFVISILMYGYILFSEGQIKKMYGDNIFSYFSDNTLRFCKEILTYIALTLGISLRR